MSKGPRGQTLGLSSVLRLFIALFLKETDKLKETSLLSSALCCFTALFLFLTGCAAITKPYPDAALLPTAAAGATLIERSQALYSQTANLLWWAALLGAAASALTMVASRVLPGFPNGRLTATLALGTGACYAVLCVLTLLGAVGTTLAGALIALCGLAILTPHAIYFVRHAVAALRERNTSLNKEAKCIE